MSPTEDEQQQREREERERVRQLEQQQQEQQLVDGVAAESPPARTRARMCICIGDVHGFVDKLQSLWDELQRSLDANDFEHASIVFLGDLVDRGPNTKDTLEWLSTLSTRHPHQRHVILAGNHDSSMMFFLGLVPAPEGFSFRSTWEHEHRYANSAKEGLWCGASNTPRESPDDADYQQACAMHYQGRRWGGILPEYGDSVYDAAATFRSYGVRIGDREGLLRAMPPHHIQVLRSMVCVHEEVLYGGWHVIAVHAGLESTKPVAEQLAMLHSWEAVARESRAAPLCDRSTVQFIPPELDNATTFLVSGHFGFVATSHNRFIIDSCAGLKFSKLSALVLPSKIIIKSAI